MQAISSGSWFTISDGCRLRATAIDSDEGHLIFGEPPYQHELTFTRDSLRTFVAAGTAMLAEIEAMAASENGASVAMALERSA